MKNRIIDYVEKKNVNLSKKINFITGDIIEVKIWVIELNKNRLQSFKGKVISIRNIGINSCFILRKISYNEGVERLFKFYSPIIYSINIIKKNKKINKSKLYYLRYIKNKYLNV